MAKVSNKMQRDMDDMLAGMMQGMLDGNKAAVDKAAGGLFESINKANASLDKQKGR